MTTISDLLKHAERIDSDTPLLDAQLLLAHVLGKSRTWLYTWPQREVADDQCRQYLALIERRVAGEPVAHLLGRQDFWTLSLEVSPATLIPRGDTELLVEQALALDLPDNARALDLGTGTGAIALALASERPGWQVVAVDSEPEAVALADRNRQANGLDNVDVQQSHWFNAVDGQFELIVSNPPYIAPDDGHLDQGDVRFEPRSALVAERGGMADLEHIVSSATEYLVPGGWLVVEHGFDQRGRVQALFLLCGYADVATCEDLGGNPRITLGRR